VLEGEAALLGRGAEIAHVAHAPPRIAIAQRAIEGLVRRGGDAALAIGPVEEQHAAGRQRPRRAREQGERDLPRRDVDHVDADDRVGLGHRPRRRGDVEGDRRREVRQARLGPPRRDARERGRIRIARLPAQRREAAGHVHRVLARAARDLEDQAARRQVAREDLADRLPVAGRRGREPLHDADTTTARRAVARAWSAAAPETKRPQRRGGDGAVGGAEARFALLLESG
jgi:hypothetical protein